jgi:hypothetical protein
MRSRVLLAVAVLWPAAARAQVAIEHDAVGCVAAGKFPRFTARLVPAESVARARLHFRPQGWPHWYSVPMARERDGFFGLLPKPEAKLARLEYYISVTDASFQESRTSEHAPAVVSGPGGCQQGKVLALAVRAARVIVHSPEGVANAPLVPAGFSTDGVVAGATARGGTSTAAAGTGATEGTYAGFAPGTRPPNSGNGPPIAGATGSTSLDSTTATTDGSGHFRLVTTTPISDASQTYTLTIRAAGCQTFNVTHRWGNQATNQVFTLVCP